VLDDGVAWLDDDDCVVLADAESEVPSAIAPTSRAVAKRFINSLP
jgi:hypothetical protein